MNWRVKRKMSLNVTKKSLGNGNQRRRQQDGFVQSFLPIEAIQTEFVISALPHNLSTWIDLEEDDDDGGESVSAYVGVIHSATFLIYHVRGFIHQLNTQHIQTIHVSMLPEIPIEPPIMHAKWLSVADQVILVLSTNSGIMFYRQDGSILLSRFDYDVVQHGFCRAMVSEEDKIIIGNGRGEILWFQMKDDTVAYWNVRNTHPSTAAITALCVHENNLIAGDTNGTISIWGLKKFVPVMTFKTAEEECVTGCCVWGQYVLSTYGSGIIRLYDLSHRRLQSKVHAHSRWIVSMDLLTKTGTFLTVAEDDVIRIWKLTNAKIKMETFINVSNMVLVGGHFLNKQGNILALANFGSKEIYIYGRHPLES